MPLRVLFAVAEAYPFVKVGGLADVGSALPKALARRGHDVRLLLPGYSCVGEGRWTKSVHIPHAGTDELVHIKSHGSLRGGVDVYAVDSKPYFGREKIYDYEDDDARFTLFSKAVAAFAAGPDWVPDVIHTSEWHLGLVPQYVRQGPHQSVLARTATVFTIHNMVYQGPVSRDAELLIGLTDGFDGSLLARGIAFADAVNTVSKYYMEEILTPEYGASLDALLRSRRDRLSGILNGVDYDEFDPATDTQIVARYGPYSLERKKLNKVVLQERAGLATDPDVPLLGMVCRLVDQKGLRLLCGALDRIALLGAQVVVMGMGDPRYEQALDEAARRNRGRIAYRPVTEDRLSRLVYAGSDFFLAPSDYEPCGLGPLIALRYGAIPLVRRTGGMMETIRDYSVDPETGLGFTFIPRYPEHLLNGVSTALATYRAPDEFERLQRRGMAANFSWDVPAQQYERLYFDALRRVDDSAVSASVAEGAAA